jgi:L-aspartate oxidase
METVVFGKRVVEHISSGVGGAAAPTPDVATMAPIGGDAPSHEALQAIMWECAGIERNAHGLRRALTTADSWPDEPKRHSRNALERRQMAILARLMLASALIRDESRGAHYRADFPTTDDLRWKRHQVFRRAH